MENQKKNVIVYGSVLPNNYLEKELGFRAKEISQRLTEEEQKETCVIQLEKDEISLILKRRMDVEKHKSTVSSLTDLQKKEDLRQLAIKMKSTIPEHLNYSYKKRLKNLTNLSWKDFNVLIENLLLHNFIRLSEEDNDMILFCISEEERIENGIQRLEELLLQTSKDIDLICAASNFDKTILKKLNLLKKKLVFKNDN